MSISSRIIDCDLDGVLCSEEKTFERMYARPNKEAIDLINQLWESNTIIIHTARGWAEYNMTADWLATHGVNYDSLVCGKLIADYRIDDRCYASVTDLVESTK